MGTEAKGSSIIWKKAGISTKNRPAGGYVKTVA